jgi:hypothetical protein
LLQFAKITNGRPVSMEAIRARPNAEVDVANATA